MVVSPRWRAKGHLPAYKERAGGDFHQRASAQLQREMGAKKRYRDLERINGWPCAGETLAQAWGGALSREREAQARAFGRKPGARGGGATRENGSCSSRAIP